MLSCPEKLIAIVPCQDRIVPAVEDGLQELQAAGVKVHRAFGQSAIDAARSRLATQALAAGYREILWIDSDVQFALADVQRLRERDLPLVGGIYPKKGALQLACAQLPHTKSIVFEADRPPVEVEYVGSGFLYTRAEVYAAIQSKFKLPLCNASVKAEALVPYFLPTVVQAEGEMRYLQEDFAFCHRAREAGFRVMADPALRLAHHGSYGWTLEDCLSRKTPIPQIQLSFIGAVESSAGQGA